MKYPALTAPSLPRGITVIKLICAITYANDPHHHKETRNKVIRAPPRFLSGQVAATEPEASLARGEVVNFVSGEVADGYLQALPYTGKLISLP